MSLDLEKQFKSLLEPEMMEEGFVNQVLNLKIHTFTNGNEQVESLQLGPLPRWFTLYETKLALWNKKQRNPAFSPSLVFMGIKENDEMSEPEFEPEFAPVVAPVAEPVTELPVRPRTNAPRCPTIS